MKTEERLKRIEYLVRKKSIGLQYGIFLLGLMMATLFLLFFSGTALVNSQNTIYIINSTLDSEIDSTEIEENNENIEFLEKFDRRLGIGIVILSLIIFVVSYFDYSKDRRRLEDEYIKKRQVKVKMK